jgi:hypothetical protein
MSYGVIFFLCTHLTPIGLCPLSRSVISQVLFFSIIFISLSIVAFHFGSRTTFSNEIDHEFLLDQIIEFICLRFLTVFNEDIFFVFVFELGSLRVQGFLICYTPEYLEMCNIGFVTAPEFLGGSIIEKYMRTSVMYIHRTLHKFLDFDH